MLLLCYTMIRYQDRLIAVWDALGIAKTGNKILPVKAFNFAMLIPWVFIKRTVYILFYPIISGIEISGNYVADFKMVTKMD